MPTKRKPRRKPVEDKSIQKILGPNEMPDITGPGGRPTLYRPDYDEMLIKHMSSGLSFESFAGLIGVCDETIRTWTKVNASFHDARRRGTQACRLFWEQLGVYYIVEGRQVEIEVPDGKDEQGNPKTKKVRTKGTEKLNANLYRLNMANRFGWKNVGSEEADGAGVTVNIHAQIMEAIRARNASGSGGKGEK